MRTWAVLGLVIALSAPDRGLAQTPVFSEVHRAGTSKTQSRGLHQELDPGPMMQARTRSGQRQTANEQYLWGLYRQGRLAELQKALDQLKKRHIQPPAELIHWLAVARINRIRADVEADSDWFAVIENAARHPLDYSCAHPGHRTLLAHAWHELGYSERAAEAYFSLMDCENLGPNARALILAAIEDLSPEDLHRLAERAAKRKLPLADLLRFHRLRLAIAASEDAGERGRLAAEARAMRTSPNIAADDWRMMADALYQRGMHGKAGFWYSEYLRQAETGSAAPTAPETLFTARWRAGRKQAAIRLLPAPGKAGGHAGAIEAALSRELFASFEAKSDQDVVNLAQALEARRRLTPDEQVVTAWAWFHLGKRKEAEARFSQLYNATGDARALEGLRIASNGGKAVQVAEGQWLYWHKEFLAARSMLENDSLRGIDSPDLTLGLAARIKSGAHPLEDFRFSELPLLQAGFTVAGKHRLRLSASRLRLEAPAHQAQVPYLDQSAAGATVPATALQGLEWALSYERSGRMHPHAEAAWLPRLSGMPTSYSLSAGILYSADRWHGDLTLFHRPYRSNALTYAGRLDNAGRPWGQISATGASLSSWMAIGDVWGGSLDIVGEQLKGSQVLSNRHLLMQLGLGRSLDKLPSDFMSIGPYLRYEHFSHNASPFTRGHGGYFSPQQLSLAGLAVDYLSPEAGQWVIRAHAEIGWQRARSAATPLFPLAATSQQLPAASSSGIGYAFETTAVARLSANLLAHGGLILRESPPSYRDIGFLLALEWQFGKRQAVFSDDLMQARLKGLFQ